MLLWPSRVTELLHPGKTRLSGRWTGGGENDPTSPGRPTGVGILPIGKILGKDVVGIGPDRQNQKPKFRPPPGTTPTHSAAIYIDQPSATLNRPAIAAGGRNAPGFSK